MSIGLVLLVTVLYLGIGVSEFINDHVGLSITFFAYALANCGLIATMKGY